MAEPNAEYVSPNADSGAVEMGALHADILDSADKLRDLIGAFQPTVVGLLALHDRIDALSDDDVRHMLWVLVIEAATSPNDGSRIQIDSSGTP